MRGRMAQRLGAVLTMLALCCTCTVSVWAAQDVPQAVKEARQGVVRIMTDIGIGTGFAVGDEEEIYIVTNHHVVEDAKQIHIYYDTGRYVTGEVVADSTSRDLCILKPEGRIPDIQVLPLETEEFDSGMAVYALGFPFAADALTFDYEKYLEANSFEDLNLDSSKSAVTMTDGVISAIRQSPAFGDQTETIQAIQTNTIISGGNSGGPLVNQDGVVVGINTMGDSTNNIYASVHVSELIRILDRNRLPYSEMTTQEEFVVVKPQNYNWVVWSCVGVAVLALAGALIITLAQRGKQKRQQDAGASQNEYWQGGTQ